MTREQTAALEWAISELNEIGVLGSEVRHMDELCRLRAALSAPKAEAGVWHPIEDAPKDGTWFVARQDGETYPCQWHVEEPDEGPGYEGWYDLFNHSFEAPTEWCPAHPVTAITDEAVERAAKAMYDLKPFSWSR